MTETTSSTVSAIDWRLWLMRLLALAGLGVSGYLTWTHLTNHAIACGGSHDCDIVQQSAYSTVLGIPVALLGVLAYATLLALLLLRGHLPEALEAYIPLAVFGISLIGVLYSAYLTYLEIYVIYAICRWCATSAIIVTAIFFLSLPDLRSGADLA
jgi:uncharacterized membrane protein